MTTNVKVRALITLLPPEEGGLSHQLPSRTRSLIVRGRHQEGHEVHSRPFPAAISTEDEQPLRPGDKDHIVSMLIHDDAAVDYLRPGEGFQLWYGHEVGSGVVSRRLFV
ncbi:hypothetical protein FH608_017785 [Nonomuraea phyllanthi]|uniref:Uncharacterized protein n=1 Tax=Nonomuraea phyllanthi TaxID=2219224 RepID=A0A5C4WJQ5_9ACTN|nr:hypothetical protein [Nonomuraea phyllanthi]KAB8194042.1 hypothetical protein FH608_017785 [Nonomuraea phyllanthi]QFY07643.1 hypothetical protein GBF35_13950 [Nonomuraea phyllanthi]